MTTPRAGDSSSTRPMVAPTSERQRERHARIIEAAQRQAAAHGFEGMQMHEVAREAEVAIGTLYRYFPSKAQLMMGISLAQMQAASEELVLPAGPCESALASFLNGRSASMCRQPLLASALMQSTVSHANEPMGREIEHALEDMMMRIAGVKNPTHQDSQVMQLLIRCWYGMLLSTLNGVLSIDEAASSIELACRALVPHLSNQQAAAGPVSGDPDERQTP